MKNIALAFPLLALVLAVSPAVAQMPSMAAPEFTALRVIRQDLPNFPFDLIQLGVREGEVRIAFSVDTEGKIDDSLAVAYTHPEFARVTLETLRRWKFEPARYRGQPIAAATEIEVKFQIEGTVVVSLTPSETLNARIFSILDGHEHFRPRALRELDRIPTPIAAPSPGFPERLFKSGGTGAVVVSFYIDEKGAVRLPSVSSDDDPELGSAAILALRNWKFEPPTVRGRPVLVRASQKFFFRPQAATPATVSKG